MKNVRKRKVMVFQRVREKVLDFVKHYRVRTQNMENKISC